jgi:hypothetical protein
MDNRNKREKERQWEESERNKGKKKQMMRFEKSKMLRNKVDVSYNQLIS